MTFKELQEKYGINPKKTLGQNFLTERHIVDQITSAVLAEDCDTVLEIGSGPGVLTENLALSGKPVICVETDGDMQNILRDRFGSFDNVSLVQADFLKWDIEGEKIACAGNLPYYITTPIIERIIEHRKKFVSAVIMVQKEVGERLMAPAGSRECSSFSLYCQYYCNISRVCKVSKGCFWPAPKVDSCVLRLEMRDFPPVNVPDEELFFDIIRAAYGMRRKTLSNALKNSSFLWWGAEKTNAVLKAAEIDGTRRGENLTNEEFARICRAAYEYKSPGCL